MPHQEPLFEFSELELKKHVGAIALVPMSRPITALQRKAYNVLIFLSQEQGEQDSYRAQLQKVMLMSKTDSSQDYRRIKQTLRSFVSTVVEWQSPSHGEFERWDACGMLSHVALIKHANGTLELEWSFARQVRDALLDPGRYARIALEYSGELKRHSSIVLMEVCVRFIENPGRVTSRHPWQWWRPVLSGKPEHMKKTKNAPEYRYFKRDVLEPALEEVNRVTHIEVALLEHKGSDNKTVIDIQFTVNRKKAVTATEARPAPVNLGILDEAIGVGLKESEADDFYRRYGEDALAWGIEEVRKRKAMPTDKIEKLGNVAAWLRTRLTSRVDQQRGHARKDNSAPPVSKLAASNTRKAKWLDEWLRRRREGLRREFEMLPEDIQAKYVGEHREALASSPSTKPMLLRFESSGWTHRMVVSDFLKRYAIATLGDGWDKPSPEQLLEIAGLLGDDEMQSPVSSPMSPSA